MKSLRNALFLAVLAAGFAGPSLQAKEPSAAAKSNAMAVLKDKDATMYFLKMLKKDKPMMKMAAKELASDKDFRQMFRDEASAFGAGG